MLIAPRVTASPRGQRSSLSWRRAIAYCLFLAAVLGPAAGGAQADIAIDSSTTEVDLWPGVRILGETDRVLSPQDALARAGEFVVPDAPHANLGARHDAVWLRVDLALAADAPRNWVFDVNYPSLNRVDVHLVTDGAIAPAVRLGDEVLFAERPLPVRTHAAALVLPPGQRHSLLLRVETTSSMILPLSLSLPVAFLSRETGAEALQGFFAGICAFLLLYSVAHWLALRDRLFGYYAASIGGIALFFLAYSGLAPKYLWGGSLWLTKNAAPLAVLLALWGGLLFLERVLRMAELSWLVSRTMVALAWIALGTAAAFVLGAIDYREAQVISTLLGPAPMILGVPAAYVRMRRGERSMAYLLAGWMLYAVGVAVMAGLLRGALPFNAWTQHAFQISSIAEMTLWLVLLGQRVREINRAGEEANRKEAVLRSMALTDDLTGLINRRGLEPVLADAVRDCRPDRMAAIFMVDLDGFKQINDQHGHDVGDQLLVAVARRLTECVRRSDRVARLGGDEFVIVAAGFRSDGEARQLGNKLLDAFDAPVALPGGHPCTVGLTIGYVLAPRDGSDVPTLLRLADAAMYAGKQGGKHCLRRRAPGGVARRPEPLVAAPQADAGVDTPAH